MFININISNNVKICIGIGYNYNPPNNNKNYEKFLECIEKLSLQYTHFIFMGDVNLNFLDLNLNIKKKINYFIIQLTT